MKEPEAGFSLIEILMVLLVVGILSAVAIPSYRDYVDKARMSEAIAMMQPARLTSAEACAINTLGNATSAQLGVSTPTALATAKTVASVTLSDIASTGLLISIEFKKFGSVAAGSSLVIKGVCANRAITWTVDPSSTVPEKFWPKYL